VKTLIEADAVKHMDHGSIESEVFQADGELPPFCDDKSRFFPPSQDLAVGDDGKERFEGEAFRDVAMDYTNAAGKRMECIGKMCINTVLQQDLSYPGGLGADDEHWFPPLSHHFDTLHETLHIALHGLNEGALEMELFFRPRIELNDPAQCQVVLEFFPGEHMLGGAQFQAHQLEL